MARPVPSVGRRPFEVVVLATVVLLAGCTAGQAVPPDASPTVAEDATSEVLPLGEGAAASEMPTIGGEKTPEVEDAEEERAAPSDSAVTEANPPASAEPEPDYSQDAGNDLQVYEYPDDPEPAESIVATLCNLDREYIASLRPMSEGVPVVDSSLRTMLVAFSDYLSHWDTLRPHYPEVVAHIDTAQEIYELWNQALLEQDNGDPDAAQDAMLQAEKLLQELPTGDIDECTE